MDDKKKPKGGVEVDERDEHGADTGDGAVRRGVTPDPKDKPRRRGVTPDPEDEGGDTSPDSEGPKG